MRPASLGALALALLAAPVRAEPILWPAIGGHEGEIDTSTTFVDLRGRAEPTPRESSWQTADTKLLLLGAGYAIGKLGPFYDCYARVDGGYFLSAAERVESPGDVLPVGTPFYPAERGGFVRGLVSTSLVRTARTSFGLFLEGTAPIKVDLRKFSTVRLHWVGGGTSLDVALTDPAALLRLRYRARFFLGSGAYSEVGQQNAQVQLDDLLWLEARRWLLPWPIGIGLGPHFEADLNEHVDAAYHDAYGPDAPDQVRSFVFALAVLPYIEITRHVAIELGYEHVIYGNQLPATQLWTGGLRTAF